MKQLKAHFFTMIALSAILLFVFFADVAYAQGGLNNPLRAEFSTIPDFIKGVLQALVIIALPIITFFFVYSGFLFVMARGNEQEISRARRNFVYTVIGAVLILGAWILATLISGTVTQLTTP